MAFLPFMKQLFDTKHTEATWQQSAAAAHCCGLCLDRFALERLCDFIGQNKPKPMCYGEDYLYMN